MGTGNFYENDGNLKLLEEWRMLETFRRMKDAMNFQKNRGNLKLLEKWRKLETSRRMKDA